MKQHVVYSISYISDGILHEKELGYAIDNKINLIDTIKNYKEEANKEFVSIILDRIEEYAEL